MGWEQWIPVIASAAGAVGQAAGQRSASRAAGRQDEAVLNQRQDQLAQSNYGANQNAMLTAGSMAEAARLDRAKLGLEAPETRTRQALWGDLIQNLKDVNVEGLGAHIPKVNFSGGLRPSAISAGGRQAAGSALQSQALQALVSGSDVPQMPDFSKLVLTPPAVTQLPQATDQDSWLNTLATIGAIANAGSELYGSTRKPKTRPGGGFPEGE